jgi:TonB family protein
LGNNEFPRNDGVGEPGAVRTTIVGGRPPGNGAIPRHIPRGVEVLIRKAAVDPAFKKLLFEKRAEAAKAIGLKLTAAEEAMLAAVPLSHLEGIVAHTRVSPKLRPAFLGYAAAAMLAALGTGITVCHKKVSPATGSAQNEDLIADAVVEKTVRIEEMPSMGIRPSTYYIRGYVIYIAGEGAGNRKRRIDYVQNRLRPVFAFVKSEYDEYLKENPIFARGNITARFTITAAGDVKNPEILTDGTGSPGIRAKTIQRIAIWKIDPIPEGDVQVVYKLNFTLPASPENPYTGVVGAITTVRLDSRTIADILAASASGGATLDWVATHQGPGTSGLTGIRPDAFTKRKHTSARVEPSVSTSAPGITGVGAGDPQRSPGVLSRITRKHLWDVNSLYSGIVKRNPNVGSGKIVVRYYVNAEGRVTNAAVVSDSVNCAALAGAVLSGISRWDFPAVNEGTVTVVQPFVFIAGDK